MRPRRTRTLALYLAGAVAGGLLAAPPAAAAPAREPTAAPVAWQPCQPDPARYDCATYPVPLDYRRPAAGTVPLAMMRRRANDPAHRIGSLFLNPGGPGGSGLRLPTVADRIFADQPQLLDRFDIVGFDPRGVGASLPLRCFTSEEDADKVFARLIAVPLHPAEIANDLAAGRDYTTACAANAGALLPHMSTLDVTRDLDRMRRGVGDAKLSYVGFSYGTLIGATYANLYPDRVRAVVIDGNVDPWLRTHDGVEYDRQRAGGFEKALGAFLSDCRAAGAPRCAFGDGDPRAKFDELRGLLRQGPITVPAGQVTLSSFTSAVGGALYQVANLAPLAVQLQGLYQVVHPAVTGRSAPAAANPLTRTVPLRDAYPDTPYLSDDSYYGVNCLDKPYPRDPARYPDLATAWERGSPTFGRTQAFDPVPCATWPTPVWRAERYTGPWDRRTANTVLVLGNYYDPATNYVFNQRMARELGRAVLVSTDTIGHTVLGHSRCADTLAARYLTDGVAPGPGIVCQPDHQPFPA